MKPCNETEEKAPVTEVKQAVICSSVTSSVRVSAPVAQAGQSAKGLMRWDLTG